MHYYSKNGDVGAKKGGGTSSVSVSLSSDLGKRMQTPEEKTHLFLEGSLFLCFHFGSSKIV